MKAIVIDEPGRGVDAWKLEHREEPAAPGPGEVLVRMRAASLNYRDLAVAKGAYGGPAKRGLVVLADGAGEVAAVGPGVTALRTGDRVMTAYYPAWREGLYRLEYQSLGVGENDGVLAELVRLPASGLVRIPDALSFEQAASLPCAAVTAWHALFEGPVPLRPGASVLVLGSGGVSIFAAQLALAAGMRVIATSSSAAKRARLEELGVNDVMDHTAPSFGADVRARTGGEGVDLVVEVGGGATLAQSFEATRIGGRIAIIGLLGGVGHAVDPLTILFRDLIVHGVHVGSTGMTERLVRAVAALRIAPVIDQVFELDEAPRALATLAEATHFGKIVVRVA